MSISAGFSDFLLDALRPLGAIRVRRMFGGAGVFCDGLMLALVVDETLFFKVDDTNRSDFEAEGLPAFSYARSDGRTTVMSFWRAPERLLDDTDELLAWTGKAHAVARRASAHSASKARPTVKRAATAPTVR